MIYDKATLDSLYNLGAEPWGHPSTRKEIRLHYNRAVMYPYAQKRATTLMKTLKDDDTILIVGCGFGWLVDVLRSHGYAAYGTEISDYILGRMHEEETEDVREAQEKVGASRSDGDRILNRFGAKISNSPHRIVRSDSMTVSARSDVLGFLGFRPSVVLSEDVTSMMNEAECENFSNCLKEYAPDKLLHMNEGRLEAVI